jgi:hypothetical protein
LQSFLQIAEALQKFGGGIRGLNHLVWSVIPQVAVVLDGELGLGSLGLSRFHVNRQIHQPGLIRGFLLHILSFACRIPNFLFKGKG